MTVANTNLKVPFNEKDQAKALGAKWDAELKLWYGLHPISQTYHNVKIGTES